MLNGNVFQSRQTASSGDEGSLMMDKDDFLGVLPDDLPFKEDDILGMLSGGQGHGGEYRKVDRSNALC